jgi:dephospho-CoA kinase
LRVGLTGNIGSGKSTVARLLAGLGAAVVDADALAREAVEDPAVLRRIAAELGDALVSGGALDRRATGRLVFADEGARGRLNAIVHPWVRQRSAERVAALEAARTPPPVIVLDIPLLYENGLERGLDAVIVVSAPLARRSARVAGRSGLEPSAVRERDAAQMPLEEKAARADFVLDNGGTREALEHQVAHLWRELMARRAGRDEPR